MICKGVKGPSGNSHKGRQKFWMPPRLIVEMGVPWQRDGEQKVKWPRMVNPPQFPALPPTLRKGQE